MSDKHSAEELAAYQRIAELELSNAQFKQRWTDQKRMLNSLLEERADLCSKLSMIGLVLQPDNTLINKAFIAPVIPDNEIIEWVRGFHEAGHFVSEEACQHFADQLKNMMGPRDLMGPVLDNMDVMDTTVDLLESTLLSIRKNLIHVLDLDVVAENKEHETKLHDAMVGYAQRSTIGVDDVDYYDYARQVGDSFKLTPTIADAIAECLVAYRELIKQ